MSRASNSIRFPVRDYDLAATLESGQAFRWGRVDQAWEGVVAGRWTRLRRTERGIDARVAAPAADWDWLRGYLQIDVDLATVVATFPRDEPMAAALSACPGLRLLRQDPWECLASFILSSNKQILQIRRMVAAICERFGDRLPGAIGGGAAWSFPGPDRLAGCRESELRECGLGYRAPYLRDSARLVSEGAVHLEALRDLEFAAAREALQSLPGVGPKIADCVLLFAYGFQEAFPIDVWVLKALKELYFERKRKVTPRRIREFSRNYFGPNGGYAQQYLFHYMRKSAGKV